MIIQAYGSEARITPQIYIGQQGVNNQQLDKEVIFLAAKRLVKGQPVAHSGPQT